jgi:spoIIIJ-associated protein
MEWVETTGRSLEDAKEAALDQLGVDEADAEFEVLEEPRAGLFGRVRGEARVRARVRPTAPRPKEDRRDRRRRGRAASEGGRSETAGGVALAEPSDREPGSSQAPGPPAGAGERDTGSDRSASNGESSAERAAAGSATAPVGSEDGPAAGAPEGTKPRRKRRRGGRSSAAKRAASAGSAGTGGAESGSAAGSASGPESGPERRAEPGPGSGAERPGSGSERTGTSPGGASSDAEVASVSARGAGEAEAQIKQGHSNNGREETAVEVSLEEQGRVAEEFLKGLVSEFGVDAAVKVTTSGEEEVKLDLSGSELGLLIGPKGSTLLALQDLTRNAVHHQTGATNGRIFVDVGAYRQKRSEALARFAQQVAAKVIESGSPTALEPMSAPDRKVVHDAVTGIEGVSTFSEGEEPRRRVVIAPASVPSS